MNFMDVGLAHFSRQVLDGLLDSNIGFAVFDERFRYRFANETLAKLHRVPPEAHEGESLRRIVGEAASKIEPALEVVFDSGKVLTRFELLSNIPTRPEVVHWTATHFPIRDGRGKLKQVGAFVIEREAPKRQTTAMRTRLFERLLVNARQTQEPLIRFSSLDERSLVGTDSERTIDGLRDAIGKSEGGPVVPAVMLSHREREIICFLANGNSNKQISAILNISIKTVQYHRARVFVKLNLDSLAGLVRYALRNRLVEL